MSQKKKADVSVPEIETEKSEQELDAMRLWKNRMNTPEQGDADGTLEALEGMGDDVRAVLTDADAFAEKYGAAYELTGQIKAASFFKKTADVSAFLLIRQMKESKLYKGMRIEVEKDGVQKLLTVNSFEEFCEHCLGVSHQKINEDLRNLSALGEEFYAASQKMGLTYRQLRLVRGLPENERDEVKKLAEAKDFDALKDILYQQMDETEKYKKEKDKLGGELKDKESLYEKALKKQHEAEIKLERFTKLPLDEQIAEREKAAREVLQALQIAEVKIRTEWAAYFVAARAVMDADGLGIEVLDMIEGQTSAMCEKIACDLQDAGIRVDFRRIVYPDALCEANPEYAALRGDNPGSGDENAA